VPGIVARGRKADRAAARMRRVVVTGIGTVNALAAGNVPGTFAAFR
jgi:hypothetical protein